MAVYVDILCLCIIWMCVLFTESESGCTNLQSCISCICNVASPNDARCGLSKNYFKLCKRGPQELPANKYGRCMRDPECVEMCIENYLMKYRRRCTGTNDPNQITCADYGRIHKGGRNKCNRNYAIRFGEQVENCCGDIVTPSSAATPSSTATMSSTTTPRPRLECGTCSSKLASAPEGFAEIFYTESNEHVENPERGFTTITTSPTSDPTPLTKSYLDSLREDDGITLVWRQWNLDLYEHEAVISEDFLNHIRADFEVIRDARMSTVVRFMYTADYTGSAPYGDADKAIMTGHIQQLSPILFEFEELITVVQAGFIGTWGEWYYTTHFGDPEFLDWSDPDNVRGLTPEQWDDRHDILNELLAATPENITVQVRYPQTKYHLLDDETPTQESDMLATNKKYRISHHNDCFLSSSTDVGTYIDFEEEYPYLMEDLKYSTIGGETCSEDSDGGGRHECDNAVVEMRELHYTYLNQAYNRIVLDQWLEDGCYDDIHRYMGYRLVLQRALLPDIVDSGDEFCFEIEISNVGYAAPVRNREAKLVFRDTSNNMHAAGIPGVDMRIWLSGTTHTITSGVTINLAPGLYEVMLVFISEYAEINSLSDYNILTANVGTGEYSTGLNNLLHTVEVTAAVEETASDISSLICDVTQPFDQEPSEYTRLYCGFGYCDDSGTPGSDCDEFALLNPSFEEIDVGWQPLNDGFVYTTDEASHGLQSVQISNGGAWQVITVPTGTRLLKIDADAKSFDIVGDNSNDYSIYCDIKMDDESWDYGVTAQFDVSNSEWHTATLSYTASQDMAEGWCYAMFRNYASGSAYFDHFHVWTSSDTSAEC